LTWSYHCSQKHDTKKLMLKYRTNRRKRRGRPLNRLLDVMDRSIMAPLVIDYDGDHELNKFHGLI
jgi:hypothetical protein